MTTLKMSQSYSCRQHRTPVPRPQGAGPALPGGVAPTRPPGASSAAGPGLPWPPSPGGLDTAVDLDWFPGAAGTNTAHRGHKLQKRVVTVRVRNEGVGAWARAEGERTATVGSGLHPSQPASRLQASATEGGGQGGCMCLVLKMSRPRLPTQHACRGPGQELENSHSSDAQPGEPTAGNAADRGLAGARPRPRGHDTNNSWQKQPNKTKQTAQRGA